MSMTPPDNPIGPNGKPIEPMPSWYSGYDERLSPAVQPFDLKKLFGLLRRHWWLMLLTTSITTGITAYYAYTQQPVYHARATVRLTDVRRELTGKLGDEAGSRDLTPNSSPVLSLIQILTSRAVAGEVVDGSEAAYFRLRTSGIPLSLLRNTAVQASTPPETLQLRFDRTHVSVRGKRQQQRVTYGTPVTVDGVRFAVTKRPDEAAAMIIVEPREKAIDRLLSSLSGQPREYTDVIDVEYSAGDPQVAQRVVNAVVTILKDHSTRSARDQSLRRRQFIEAQLRQNDSLLAVAQRELGAFRNQSKSYSARDKFTATQEGLAALAMKREELDADRRMYGMLLQSVENSRGAAADERLSTLVSAPGITNNPVVTQLFSQLARFQGQRDSLTTGPWASAATHPDVVRLDTLMAATRGKLLAAAQNYIESLNARVEVLDEIASTRSADALRGLPASEAQEGLLIQRTETMGRLSDQLREEYQKARMTEAVQAGDVEIVDLAPLPQATLGVGRTRKLAVGIVVGILLGAGIAYMIENLNTSIRRRSDMESLLRIPGLAVIPRMTANGLKGARPVGRIAAWRTGAKPPRAADGLITASNLGSSSAEAYRTLRTNLLFSQVTRRLKTIVITSTSPGDGKTTVSTNLSVTFAQQGLRVLLIDCDLRRPRVHQVFGLPRSPGLTELVMEYSPAEDVIVPTPVNGLFMLPAGGLPPNPAELLGGLRMRGLLETLAKDFDLVVLDSPPVLAASDSAILGAMADGVLMVVRAGQTDRDAARAALKQLATVGARVVGAVLNDPDASVPQYAEFYEYTSSSS